MHWLSPLMFILRTQTVPSDLPGTPPGAVRNAAPSQSNGSFSGDSGTTALPQTVTSISGSLYCTNPPQWFDCRKCQVKAFGTPGTHGIPTSSKLKTCNTGSGLSAPSVTPGKATKNRLGFQSYKSPPKRRPKHFCRMGANIVGNLFLILGCVILDEHDAGIQRKRIISSIWQQM